MRSINYLFALLPAVMVWFSWTNEGWLAWTSVWFIFGVIPLLELTLGIRKQSVNESEMQRRASDRSFDMVLYLLFPVQFGMIFYFGELMSFASFKSMDTWGHIFGMGILCGGYGINVAHELGHRQQKGEQWMAKMLLCTSLYMHFFIEHNRGHHKHVATPEDPSTARKNETVFVFWLRSMSQTYRKAWALEFERLRREGNSRWHWGNQMIHLTLIQTIYLGVMYFLFGSNGLLAVVFAGIIGAVLLETINYIEHYGLLRKRLPNGYYEKLETKHSWNSDHAVGRLLLFELSRHSDHHFKSNKKYQTLISSEDAPQMPTGYPGMMVLSLIAPLWFKVMNPRLEAIDSVRE